MPPRSSPIEWRWPWVRDETNSQHNERNPYRLSSEAEKRIHRKDAKVQRKRKVITLPAQVYLRHFCDFASLRWVLAFFSQPLKKPCADDTNTGASDPCCRRHAGFGNLRRHLPLGSRRPRPGASRLSCRQRPAGALAGRGRFVILETGFGLGLNFLATWLAWRDDPQRCQELHFVAFEKHPFQAADLALAQAAWPEFALIAEQLRQRWPALEQGEYRLEFESARLVLTLVFGDAVDILPRLATAVDAF